MKHVEGTEFNSKYTFCLLFLIKMLNIKRRREEINYEFCTYLIMMELYTQIHSLICGSESIKIEIKISNVEF